MSWLIETLIATTLLMGAVMLLRPHVRRYFGPQVAYALWALPVLRLVLPPIPESWREAAATPISQVGETVTVLILPMGPAAQTAMTAAAAAPAAASGPDLPIALVLGLAWAGGALLFLGWHALVHWRFCRRLLATATLLATRDGVRVVESDAATGPLAFGVRRRYVAFPRDFADRYDPLERELALDHELGHHARGDLVANWVALAMLALHWFNPLAWRAFRAFRADQELANDARVLAGRSRADRHIYACAIVKAAHGGAVSAACHLHTIDDLKGRLRMLTVSKTSRRRLATGAATVSLLGALGLGLTVSGSEAAAAISDKVQAAVQPPVPPAPPMPDAPMTTPAPPLRPEAVAPPAPPVPPAVGATRNSDTTTVTTKDGKVTRVRVVNRTGTPVDMSQMVNITSGDCGPDKGQKAFVITKRRGNADATVICTDRITAAAMAGDMTKADSDKIERQALTAALTGLRGSRSSIAGNASMTAEQKNEALSGIDEAIAEVEGDLAKVGKED